jgi:hypothetical protein
MAQYRHSERTKGATAERQKFSAMLKMHALNGVAGNPRKALDGRRTGKRGKSRGCQAVAHRCLTIAGKYGTSG